MSLEELGGNSELPHLHVVGVRDNRADEDVAGAGDGRQALRHHSAGARLRGRELQATASALVQDELGDRRLVGREEMPLKRFRKLQRKRVRACLRSGIYEQVHMNLEVACTDRRLDAVTVTARLGERSGDGRLARTEEPEVPAIRRRRLGEQCAQRFRVERARPQPL